jgi:gas vesicle protein
LAGLAVGALIGVLYAPKSGRETRENVAQGAREGTEYLRARSRQAAEQVGPNVGRGREVVEDFVEHGKNLVQEQTSRVGAAVDAGREVYEENAKPSEPTA